MRADTFDAILRDIRSKPLTSCRSVLDGHDLMLKRGARMNIHCVAAFLDIDGATLQRDGFHRPQFPLGIDVQIFSASQLDLLRWKAISVDRRFRRAAYCRY